MNHLRENIRTIDERLNEIMKNLDEHEDLIEERVKVTEMGEIEALLKALPTVPDIESWKQKLKDDNIEFLKDVDQFKHDFNQQNEIIRRFDEVLNDKVSKHTVKENDKMLRDEISKVKIQMSLE